MFSKKNYICGLCCCLMLLIPPVAAAQGGKTVKTLMAAGWKPGDSVSKEFILENMKVKLPSFVMHKHGADVVRRYVERQIPLAMYRQAALRNNRRLLGSLQRFLKEREVFLKNKEQILANRQWHLFESKLPYANYLPKDLQVLYVGECHYDLEVAREMESLLAQLPQIYPGRRIYLATEFLPFGSVISSPAELEKVVYYNPQVFQTALKNGIFLLGLENDPELISILQKEIKQTPNWDMYYAFSTSFEGVRVRNGHWSRMLQALQQEDPTALIVVYAGFSHVVYNEVDSVSSMLGGRAFVISMINADFILMENSYAGYFPMPLDLVTQFNELSHAKLVASWKKKFPFKKLFGSDLTVIL